jgi:hypothetical protein
MMATADIMVPIVAALKKKSNDSIVAMDFVRPITPSPSYSLVLATCLLTVKVYLQL